MDGDFFLKHLDNDHPGPSSNETEEINEGNKQNLAEKIAEHSFTGVEDHKLARVAKDIDLQVIAPNPTFASRTGHLTAPRLRGVYDDDVIEDILRPYTTDAFPSNGSHVDRQRKHKTSPVRKKTSRDDEISSKERPHSADVNGWGDFDTDRLLRDDFGDELNWNSQDPLDNPRSRSRKSQRSTPATNTMPSQNTDLWESSLTMSRAGKGSSKPPMQVLHLKSIKILSQDLETPTNQLLGRAVTAPKQLLGRTSLEKNALLRLRPTTNYALRPATPSLLFGAKIPDTPNNRAFIFEQLANLWLLIPHRSRMSLASEPAIVVRSSDTQLRSSFECSNTMAKLCKTVGISLTPSAATHASFWTTNGQDVDFKSFCSVVVEEAIQPALHHFNLDNFISEYISVIETIVQSLITTLPVPCPQDKAASFDTLYRLKELDEIQPVFMSWRVGITPQLALRDEHSSPTSTRVRILAPSEEAHVTHAENIRRKVQLHKSWKISSEGQNIKRKISSPVPHDTRTYSRESQRSTSNQIDLEETQDGSTMELVANGARSNDVFSPKNPVDTPCANDVHSGNYDVAKSEEVLVCSSCSAQSAVLWCSLCFMVSCQQCWQDLHGCTVDMTMVSHESTNSFLGPTAFGMKQKHDDSSDLLRPPVAMIYLPTKPIVSGTLAKGKPVDRHSSVASSNGNKDRIPGVVANALLPPVHKSQPATPTLRHMVPSTPVANSTAKSVKNLSSTTPARDSRVHTTRTRMRLYQRHASNRPKLHLASISIDADLPR